MLVINEEKNVKKVFLLFMLMSFASAIWAGELAQKAARFDHLIATSHTPHGLVVSLLPSPHGNGKIFRSSSDSTIWTGAYIASQIFRFRVTGEAEALENSKKSLRAFVKLHKMAGSQGFIGRSFGTPEEMGNSAHMVAGVGSFSHLVYKANTSRDQYTGILMGCGIAWKFIDDQALKEEIKEMVLAVAENLQANNLALRATINGVSFSSFNLNPDYAYQDRISPEEWAGVDDFPANVFAAHVKYSERLAAIISRFQPPAVRGGEALRALMMLQTASNITADNKVSSYFKDELMGRRQLHIIASDTSQLLADIFYGRNQKVVGDRLRGTLNAALRVFAQAMGMYAGCNDSIYLFCEPAILLPVAWFADAASARLLAALDFLRAPEGFRVLQFFATELEKMAANLRWFKAEKLAQKLLRLAGHLNTVSHSNMDEFADTMRSYVGCNLSFFALLGILEQDSEPQLQKAALAILPRTFAPIADEGNSLYTFIEAAFCGRSADDPLVEAARQTLHLYCSDTQNRYFDNRDRFKPSLWPDRFGRYGRQSVAVIPINQRAPHIFVWQEPPRMLVTGADDGSEIAPVGYLLAYWFGRLHGLIAANQ